MENIIVLVPIEALSGDMFIIELQKHNSRTDVFMFDKNNSIRAMRCHIDNHAIYGYT